jgi:hypothetical protein
MRARFAHYFPSRLLATGTLFVAAATFAEPPADPYPRMAALEKYVIPDRQSEINLARSAAPASISEHATTMVLGGSGYEKAVAGDNGFTCLVERSWMSPFDSSDFWNPKVRGPVCYNPPATRSILPYTIGITNLVLAHQSKEQINAKIRAMIGKELPAKPEAGAMSYMMSKDGYLGDGPGHWHPHLMFHLPKSDAATWGANMPGSPVQLDDAHHDFPEPESIFFVLVANWSDGSSATQ